MTEIEPDFAADINRTVKSLRKQQEELDEFANFLDEADEQISNLDETKQRAFYDSVDSLQQKVQDVERVPALLALKEEITESIHSPLRESALDSFDDFIAETGADLSDGDIEDLREDVENSVQSELESTAETYQDLAARVAEYPPELTEIIADWIEQFPNFVTTRRTELEENIINLETRFEALTTIDDALVDTEWAPEGTLTDNRQYFRNLEYDLPDNAVCDDINTIDTIVAALDEDNLRIINPVQNNIDDRLDGADIGELPSAFAELASEITDLKNRYDKIRDYAEALEEFGTDRGLFESEVDDLLAKTERLKINSYNTTSALKNELRQLKREYDGFFESVAERLNAQWEMVADLRQNNADLEEPSVSEKLADTNSISTATVSYQPLAMLEACKAYDEWLKARFEQFEGNFETSDAIHIWERLYEGEEVRISEDNKDEILALASRFTLNVVLGSE